MADTTFTFKSTIIASDWLNDVNTAAYRANSGILGVTSSMYRTLESKASDNVVIDDFLIIGETDYTNAMGRIATYLNAKGGGVIRSLAGKTYNVACPIGSQLALFTNCQGIVLDFSGSTINDTTTYAAGQTARLFKFSGCTKTSVRARIVTQCTTADSIGMISAMFISGCVGIDVDIDMTGGQGALFCTSTSAAAYSDKCRDIRGSIRTQGTGGGNGTHYPYAGQFSGYNVDLDIDSNSAGRSFYVYGAKQNRFRVHCKNQRATALIAAFEGKGCESVNVDFFDRDSDTNQPAAPRITINWADSTPATHKDISLHVDFLNPSSSPWGNSITFGKYSDGAGTPDVTGRGHVLDGFYLTGNMDLQGTNSGLAMTAGAFAATDVCRDVNIGPLTLTGNQALTFVNTPLVVLNGRATFNNVTTTDAIYPGADPANGEWVLIGCSAGNFSAATNETNRHIFIGCHVTDGSNLSRINKTFIDTNLMGTQTTSVPSATIGSGNNTTTGAWTSSITDDQSFNDASAHDLTGAYSGKSGEVVVTDTGGNVVIPFFCSGGAGVAFRWTVIDPDTGWVVNAAGFSFSFAVSGGNTYTLAGNSNTGIFSIQRTAGAAAYSACVRVSG